MHSVLLLGGNGFIGRALAHRYAGLGRTVHIISRREFKLDHPRILTHQGSLDDPQLLGRLVPECDVIIHAASTCTPGSSMTSPSKEGKENLLPLLSLLEILSKHAPRQLMFISSGGTVYGNSQNLHVGEDSPLSPISYHGATKAAAELYLQAFSRSGYPITVLRPSNVYGPGQQDEAGFGLVRSILQHLKMNTPLEIWGDGENIRDFLYIDDLVNAIIQAQQQNCIGVFNVGTGIGYSVNEVIALAESVIGRKLQIAWKPARRIDVKGIVLDCSKLMAETGWTPRIDLKTGIAGTWSWLSEQP